jgi:hypothetical protein
MNEKEFWLKLQQLTYNSDNLEIAQIQWERLIKIYDKPSLATKLIIETLCNGAVYLTEQCSLNFPGINPHIPVSSSQQIALEMAFSNSALSLILGTAATGKTRIATNIAHAAITHQKRILILTHNSASLTAYQNLPTYPFLLSQPENYQQWIINQLRYQHLSQPQMDYLPLHLLPDLELAKLRTPAKLETWLTAINNKSSEELIELLKPEFPDLQPVRIQLLAYRLKKLQPLLQQQLKLTQLYSNLSDVALREIVSQIMENPQIPILGTVAEFMQIENKYLWETNFDLIVVEEAHYLNWIELILLSGITNKLILIGEDTSQQDHHFNHPYKFLSRKLLPAYLYQLKEQYRLHQEIAKFVYPVICDDWIHNQRTDISYHIPQIRSRLIWQDFPNDLVNKRIIEFLINTQFTPEFISEIGIITLSNQAQDWFQYNLPSEYENIFFGTVTEWTNIEKRLVIVSFAEAENITYENTNILLTRAKDYLMLFGDYDFYLELNSPIREFLSQPGIYRERQIVLS